jgi:hypothetical protein
MTTLGRELYEAARDMIALALFLGFIFAVCGG